MKRIAIAAVVVALAAGVFLVERLTRKPATIPTPSDGALVLSEPDYILLEAEGAALTPLFRAADDAEASVGKAIEIPAKHGDAPVHEHLPGADKSEATLSFSVPEAGDYFIWFRFWACCACGDSFAFRIDEGQPAEISSSNHRLWHWVSWRFQDPERMGQLRPIRLAAGAHRLRLSFREDGFRLDQILLTREPEDAFTPARIMKPRPAAPAAPKI